MSSLNIKNEPADDSKIYDGESDSVKPVRINGDRSSFEYKQSPKSVVTLKKFKKKTSIQM